MISRWHSLYRTSFSQFLSCLSQCHFHLYSVVFPSSKRGIWIVRAVWITGSAIVFLTFHLSFEFFIARSTAYILKMTSLWDHSVFRVLKKLHIQLAMSITCSRSLADIRAEQVHRPGFLPLLCMEFLWQHFVGRQLGSPSVHAWDDESQGSRSDTCRQECAQVLRDGSCIC